jgi:hypothetical protein
MTHVKCLACFVIIGVNEISTHQNGRRHQRAAQHWNYKFPIFIPTANSFVPKKWRYKRQLEEDLMEEHDFCITYSNNHQEIDKEMAELEHSLKRTKIQETSPTEHFGALEGRPLFETLNTRYQDGVSDVVNQVSLLFI